MRGAAYRFGLAAPSPIAWKQGESITLAFTPACCWVAAPGTGDDRGDGQGSPAKRPVDPSWIWCPQCDPACALAFGTASIAPSFAPARHPVIAPEPSTDCGIRDSPSLEPTQPVARCFGMSTAWFDVAPHTALMEGIFQRQGRRILRRCRWRAHSISDAGPTLSCSIPAPAPMLTDRGLELHCVSW